MVVHRMSNPKLFVKDCEKSNVTLEYLLEAHECIGKQATARMFYGKSKRGGGGFASAASIENWMETFKYANEHPDEEDHEQHQSREVLPTDEWKEFLELIHRPIDQLVIDSWEKMSKKMLGEEAKKYGITFGIANSKAIANIHERMNQMIERRKSNFWNKTIIKEELVEQTLDENALKNMNIFQLRELAKERNISTNLCKDDMINEIIAYREDDISAVEYIEMSTSRLKLIAKDRGLLEYNNLKKDELVEALKLKDVKDQEENDKKDRIMLGGIEIISREGDGYINATQLCKAGGKEFKNWYRNDKVKEFLEELSVTKKIDICPEKEHENPSARFFTDPKIYLIDMKLDCDIHERCTWVYPQVAIHIAQWLSPKFAVIVTGWVQTLLSTGNVSIERPVKAFATITQMDVEAEELESTIKMEEHTADSVLYISYIGRGMVKVGYSDGRLVQRNKKHTSTESMYSQWRIVHLLNVSGRPIEKILHEFLFTYQAEFNKQKEIYKPIKSIKSFINMVSRFVDDNDLPMKIRRLESEVQQLKLENMELRLQLKDKK
jgi:hypothetical protein